MPFSTETFIAFRYLRARKQEGFISIIAGFSLVGIALGVATLIVVMSVMNGFRHELIGRLLGVDGHVTVSASTSQGMPDYEALVAEIGALPRVTRVIPMVEGQVMLTSKNQAAGAHVRGLRQEDLAQKPLLAERIPPTALEAFTGHNGVILGYRLAQRLGLREGDEVTLVSPRSRATVLGAIPRMKSYPILATFDLGMYEYDGSLVLLPMEAAQTYFALPGAANALEVIGENPGIAPLIVSDISQIIPAHYQVYDWQRSHFQFFNALQVERNVMFLILTLIIVVAAFNIISSLIMLVRSKVPDIAILRTMGATRGSITRIFLLCGASIGVVGTLLGVMLGLAFSLNIESIRQALESLTGTELFAAEIYFLSTLPARVEYGEVVQVTLMALMLSFLATLYPSWKAARTDPAEALRYG